jgi:hypothetical protein
MLLIAQKAMAADAFLSTLHTEENDGGDHPQDDAVANLCLAIASCAGIRRTLIAVVGYVVTAGSWVLFVVLSGHFIASLGIGGGEAAAVQQREPTFVVSDPLTALLRVGVSALLMAACRAVVAMAHAAVVSDFMGNLEHLVVMPSSTLGKPRRRGCLSDASLSDQVAAAGAAAYEVLMSMTYCFIAVALAIVFTVLYQRSAVIWLGSAFAFGFAWLTPQPLPHVAVAVTAFAGWSAWSITGGSMGMVPCVATLVAAAHASLAGYCMRSAVTYSRRMWLVLDIANAVHDLVPTALSAMDDHDITDDLISPTLAASRSGRRLFVSWGFTCAAAIIITVAAVVVADSDLDCHTARFSCTYLSSTRLGAVFESGHIVYVGTAPAKSAVCASRVAFDDVEAVCPSGGTAWATFVTTGYKNRQLRLLPVGASAAAATMLNSSVVALIP